MTGAAFIIPNTFLKSLWSLADERSGRWESGRTVSAHGSDAAHLVPGMRNRHDRQLFCPGPDRIEGGTTIAGAGFWYRVHGAGCGLCEAGFVPHHARTGHSLRHWTEAGESEAERSGLFGRWRLVGDRREPLDSRRPAEHRSQSHLREQPDLCDDGRADRADYAGARHYIDLALRHV